QFSFSVDGCWGSLLANFLQRKCDVVNRGFSGYNTRWCNIMIDEVFSEFETSDIAMVTIFLGANDSNLPDNKHQHVPLVEYKQHLEKMVEKLQNRGISRDKIVLISPPACDEIAWEQDCIHNDRPFHKCNISAGEFAKNCVQVAKETGTKYVDLYTEMMKSEDWRKMLNDGLHLSPRGSELLFCLLKPHVTKATGHMTMIYPDWKDIDNGNPELALGS
ncbi:hypothetical protein FSP39_017670, partial [Pinctada imbricata]